METTFRLSTLRHLLMRDLFMERNRLLIAFAIMAGIMVPFGYTHLVLDPTAEAATEMHLTAYNLWFILFGLLHIASSFREFAQVGTLQDYLLLPASTLEKWTARWLKTLPLFIVAITVAYTLMALLIHLLLLARGIQGLPMFQPFQPEVIETWKNFLLIHAIFFTGSIHFNRQPMQKTLVTLIIVFSSFMSVTLAVLFSMMGTHANIERDVRIDGDIFTDFTLWPWLLSGAVTLFLWFVSYLKLTEKEV